MKAKINRTNITEHLIEYQLAIFKFNKSKAESTFGWFDCQFGLRIKF